MGRMEETMKIYEELKLDIWLYECFDVITASGDISGDNEFEDPFAQ